MMDQTRKLFVGNLPFSTTQEDLARAFAAVGTVEEATVVTDRETNRPRGFGFVTMATQQDAARAVDRLNGSDFGGRKLTVNIAQPKAPRDGNGYQSRRTDRDRDHRGAREPRW